jgi:serine/threonine-protein phosphatase 2A activator
MLKMYQAEVLNKLPVIQHFLFGSILPYEGPQLSPSQSSVTTNSSDISKGKIVVTAQGKEIFVHDYGHPHDHGHDTVSTTGWGDCCGIPVPSAFAAAQMDRDHVQPGQALGGPGIRPVPFD